MDDGDAPAEDEDEDDMSKLSNDLDATDNTACPAASPTVLCPDGRHQFIAENGKKSAGTTNDGNSKVEKMMAEPEALKKHGEERAQQMNADAQQRFDALDASVGQASTQMTNLSQQLTDMQIAINNNNEAANQRMAVMESINQQQQTNDAAQFQKIMDLLTENQKKDDSDDDKNSKSSSWRTSGRRTGKRASSASPSNTARTPGGTRKRD